MLEAGGGFAAEVRQLVSILRSKDPPAQTVLVTATMSKAVKQLVTAFLPDLIRIEAAGFHKPVATARHEFRLLSPGGDKMQLLLEVLQSDVAKGRKVVVFCNSMNSCRAVEHTVRERDMPTVCYHGDMPISARKEAMAQFAGTGGRSGWLARGQQCGPREEEWGLLGSREFVASSHFCNCLQFCGFADVPTCVPPAVVMVCQATTLLVGSRVRPPL